MTGLDAALRVIEAGGCLEGAHAASGPKGAVVPRETISPAWPAHKPAPAEAGGDEHLPDGQCFADVPTHDARGRLPMRPATAVPQSTSLGC